MEQIIKFSIVVFNKVMIGSFFIIFFT